MSRSILVVGDVPNVLDYSEIVNTLKGYFQKDDFLQNNSVESVRDHREDNDQDGARRAFIVKFSYPIGAGFKTSERKINFGSFSTDVVLRLCPDEGQQEEAREKVEHDEQNKLKDDENRPKQRRGLETNGVGQIIRDSTEGEGELNRGEDKQIEEQENTEAFVSSQYEVIPGQKNMEQQCYPSYDESIDLHQKYTICKQARDQQRPSQLQLQDQQQMKYVQQQNILQEHELLSYQQQPVELQQRYHHHHYGQEQEQEQEQQQQQQQQQQQREEHLLYQQHLAQEPHVHPPQFTEDHVNQYHKQELQQQQQYNLQQHQYHQHERQQQHQQQQFIYHQQHRPLHTEWSETRPPCPQPGQGSFMGPYYQRSHQQPPYPYQQFLGQAHFLPNQLWHMPYQSVGPCPPFSPYHQQHPEKVQHHDQHQGLPPFKDGFDLEKGSPNIRPHQNQPFSAQEKILPEPLSMIQMAKEKPVKTTESTPKVVQDITLRSQSPAKKEKHVEKAVEEGKIEHLRSSEDIVQERANAVITLPAQEKILPGPSGMMQMPTIKQVNTAESTPKVEKDITLQRQASVKEDTHEENTRGKDKHLRSSEDTVKEKANVTQRVLKKEKHTIDGVTLTVKKKKILPIDRRSLLLTGLPDEVRKNDLEMYLENYTGIDDTPMLFFGETVGRVLVRYQEELTVIESVLPRKHTINNVQVEVGPFHESIGYVVSTEQPVPSLPDPLPFSYDAKLLEYVKGKTSYMKELDEEMSQQHSQIDWVNYIGGDTLVINPTLSVKTPNVHAVVKTWSKDVRHALCEYMKRFKTVPMTVNEGIWQQVKHKVLGTKTEGLKPECDDTTTSIILTGLVEDVEYSVTVVRKVIDDIETELEKQRQQEGETELLNDLNIKELVDLAADKRLPGPSGMMPMAAENPMNTGESTPKVEKDITLKNEVPSKEDIQVDKAVEEDNEDHRQSSKDFAYGRANVTQRVLKKEKHAIDGVALTVKEKKILPMDRRSLLLTGLPDEVRKNDLEMYLENYTGIDDTPMLFFGETVGRVLVRYQEELTDIDKVIKKINQKKFKSTYLTASSIEISNCIVVKGLPANADKDGILLYFENRRSGGGEVLEVKVDCERNSALVFFENYKVIESVLPRKHTINNVQVEVGPFHESIGYVVSTEQPVPSLPDPLPFSYDAKLLEYVKGKTSYMKELDEEMSQQHSQIDWVNYIGGDTLVINPTLSVKTPNVHAVVKTWSKEVRDTLCEYMKRFKTVPMTVNEGIWQQVKHKVLGAKTEGLEPEWDDETTCVILTGLVEDVESSELLVRKVIDEIETELEKQRRQEDETVQLNELNIKKLMVCKFVETIATRYPDLNASLDKQSKSITLRGTHDDVDGAKLKMFESFNKMAAVRISPPSKSLFDFLSSEEVSSRIHEFFLEKNLEAAFSVEEQDIFCTAVKRGDVEAAVEIIRDSADETIIKIPPQSEVVLHQNEWGMLVNKLKSDHRAEIAVLKDDALNVKITSFKSSLATIEEDIVKFLKTHTIIEDVLKGDREKLQVLFQFEKEELDKLKQGRLRDVEMTMDVRGRVGAITIKGTEEDIKATKDALKTMVNGVIMHTYTSDKPGIQNLFAKEKGKTYLRAIEEKVLCVITINDGSKDLESSQRSSGFKCDEGEEDYGEEDDDDDDDEEEEEEESSGVFFVPKRSDWNVPLSTFSHFITAEGKTIRLVKGNIAKQKADIIVNTVERTCDLNTGAISKSILQAAGDDLQDDINDKMGSFVNEGDLIITDGGKLNCKAVFHICILGTPWDNGIEAKKLLHYVIQECLKTAHKKRMCSIAIPAMGTGNLGYPKDVTARILYEEIKKFSRQEPGSTLSEVKVVVYDQDQPTCQAFEDEMARLRGNRPRHEKRGIPITSTLSVPNTIRTGKTSFKTAEGKILMLVQGSIANQQCIHCMIASDKSKNLKDVCHNVY
ncbi:uncharacterized protein [Ptychodera flava]|uniref:uncharacterized protein n=1 Tax=Ptychodera flava TaxID=63121 RepID=UPI00396A3A17